MAFTIISLVKGPLAFDPAVTTNCGLVLRSLTTTQRNALAAPATGSEIYNTTTAQVEIYNGAAWVALGGTLYTAGSVLFAGTNGIPSQDNADFSWDSTNNQLLIGQNVPNASPGLYLQGYTSGTDWDGGSGLKVGGAFTITRNGSNLYNVTRSSGPLIVQGNLDAATTLNIGDQQPVGSVTKMYIHPFSAGQKGIVVQGQASHTANLQEWQDSTGAVLAEVQSNGSYLSRAGNGVFGQLNDSTFSVCTVTFGTSYERLYASSGNRLSLRGYSGVDVETFSSGGPSLRSLSYDAASISLVAKGAASQTANLQEWHKSDGTIYGTVTENGYSTTRKTSAPADAELSNSELAYWLDDTIGATKAMFKAKDSGGTVRTGSVALT